VTSGPVDTAYVGQQVAAALAGLGLPDPVVNVSAAASLDRTATGKLRRFIPLPLPHLQGDGARDVGITATVQHPSAIHGSVEGGRADRTDQKASTDHNDSR
jgi:hypothetical protein